METTHQRKVFEFLKTQIPNGKSLADLMGELLFVSADSAYRRIRGETPLTLDELRTICQHFNLSADQLLELKQPNRVLFDITQVSSQGISLTQYIQKIAEQFQYLLQAKHCHITYCSKDLPLFHFFLIPELMAFKFHFWVQVIAQDESMKDQHFSIGSLSEESRLLCLKTLDLYNQIPSTEIWNSESINGTLNQISYYRQMGLFSAKADELHLYQMLDEVLLHLEKEVEAATKFQRGQNPEFKTQNFRVFNNQISLADTIMLAETDTQQIALVNYGVLNYITSEDKYFAQCLKGDMNNIMKRSTQLSEANERLRAKFFNGLHQTIEAHR